MKIASVFLFCLVTATGAPIASGNATIDGIQVKYETRLEPESPRISRVGAGYVQDNRVMKRYLCNFENRTYFGYNLSIEPLPQNRFRLHFAPLSITPKEMTEIFKQVSDWSPLPLPNGSTTMDVQAGDTLALDLFVHASTGQKVTDYLTVDASGRATEPIVGTPRDFKAEDATIEIRSPRVSVEGRAVSSLTGAVLGPLVWINLPGHGRFAFSLTPRPNIGMQLAGEIRGSDMIWRSGGREYSIAAAKPIVPGSRPYNLYVLHLARMVEEFSIGAGTVNGLLSH